MKTRILLFIVIAGLVCSCSNNQDPEIKTQKCTIKVGMPKSDNQVSPRLVYGERETNAIPFYWEKNDKIKISVVGGSSADFTIKGTPSAKATEAEFEGDLDLTGKSFNVSCGPSSCPTSQKYKELQVASNTMRFESQTCTLSDNIELIPMYDALMFNVEVTPTIAYSHTEADVILKGFQLDYVVVNIGGVDYTYTGTSPDLMYVNTNKTPSLECIVLVPRLTTTAPVKITVKFDPNEFQSNIKNNPTIHYGHITDELTTANTVVYTGTLNGVNDGQYHAYEFGPLKAVNVTYE